MEQIIDINTDIQYEDIEVDASLKSKTKRKGLTRA